MQRIQHHAGNRIFGNIVGECTLFVFDSDFQSTDLHSNTSAVFASVLLALLVNDSEYSQSTGAKPIFKSLLAVFRESGNRQIHYRGVRMKHRQIF